MGNYRPKWGSCRGNLKIFQIFQAQRPANPATTAAAAAVVAVAAVAAAAAAVVALFKEKYVRMASGSTLGQPLQLYQY